MKLYAARYIWVNLMWISVMSVSETEHSIFVHLSFMYVCVQCICDCHRPVKWQTLKSREFALSFVLNLRKQLLGLTKWRKKPLMLTTWVQYKLLNSICVSNLQALVQDFESSCYPIRLDWWECGECWGECVFNNACTILDLRQIAAEFVPVCSMITTNKTNLVCASTYKNRPERTDTF